ncbi:MAG: SLC13 family permease [Myxococcota bacterium]|nr:SLC13 family permease [Myxococcota bacterium]
MTLPQLVFLAILGATIVLFLRGRWRHDMVALASLLACVVTGLVPAEQAFAGFGHPAVITVACVLVISRGLQTSGAIDALAQRVVPGSAGPTLAIAALTALGTVLSAFMNNVGALALLMPVAIQVAAKQELPPGQVLMPLAFGSILGGMTTLIGTPPNLIVSGFRGETSAGTFAMFDFAPVGMAVAGVGVLFVVLVGWRLVPRRERTDIGGFETGAYLTEVRVPEKSKADGKTVGEIEPVLDEADAQVIGMVRSELRISAPLPGRRLRAGDILVIEAEPDGLSSVLSKLGLELEEDLREADQREANQREAHETEKDRTDDEPVRPDETQRRDEPETNGSEEISLSEFAVLPGSSLEGRSATDISLRTRFGISLLAVSRQGQRAMNRLRNFAMRAGDVLLMQGSAEALAEFALEYGCVPLADRSLRIPDRRQALLATAILAGAIGAAAFGLLPAAIAFSASVLAAMALRLVPPRKVYETIDWPVIVLLGALIPVAGAMATTGTAALIADFLLESVTRGSAVAALAVILIATMTLSDFMNNAATAAVMCPIAIGAAERLQSSADPFLMAVAVGASCAFLTPIGHQNSTLILGPGGFHFGDYWRLGLPLELLVLVVGIPMILLVWPL